MNKKQVVPAALAAGGLSLLTLPAAAQAQPCLTDSSGPVNVPPGSEVCYAYGTIHGSVNVGNNGFFVAENEKITGSVNGNNAFAVLLCNNKIGGAVNVYNSFFVGIGDPDDNFCSFVGVSGERGGNTIGGGVVTSGNFAQDVSSNTIQGGVSIMKNRTSLDAVFNGCGPGTCTGPTEVGGNKINGSLNCFDNPNGVGTDEGQNMVAGATNGQCVNEGTLK